MTKKKYTPAAMNTKRDHRGEERPVLDDAAVDDQHQGVEAGLAEWDGDDRVDDVGDQRGRPPAPNATPMTTATAAS